MKGLVFESDSLALFHGNCLEVLKTLPDAYVDSVVTDPPYELGFMGKSWDASGIAYSVELWREVLRVLKPGGHLLAFGATRTYHRMTVAIEDAGFEIRDSLHWIYGTGFPKSMNVGDGRGTALKPAHEPIVMARKPLIGTVEKNLSAFGTGAINIDASRIGDEVRLNAPASSLGNARTMAGGAAQQGRQATECVGRWPANVLFDEDAAAELDAQRGTLKSGALKPYKEQHHSATSFRFDREKNYTSEASEGGASRFFYVAKPSRAERDEGLEHLPAKTPAEALERKEGSAGLKHARAGANHGGARNFHPTVKPLQLMRYLIKLVTPPGGIVLEPFAGSGTTLLAAQQEGFNAIGVELTEDYLPIILGRLGVKGKEAA